MDAQQIYPENTRLRKTEDGTLEILQASVLPGEHVLELDSSMPSPVVKLIKGDHAADLEKVCENLQKAKEYAANDTQRRFLAEYIESFRTGSLESYRDSQRTWISDQAPKVENIFGFVEPYRDPYNIRAEFEGLVALVDPFETKLLTRLVENSDKFICRLPWASAENSGKGVFEKTLFEPPDFSSIHSLAYCSSIIFPGINLPNYNDIRQDVGFKNVIIANRMAAESTAATLPFIDSDELPAFRKAELVGAYLMDDKELLVLFGFTETTEIKASDVTYNLYQQLGVDCLRGLANFNVDSMMSVPKSPTEISVTNVPVRNGVNHTVDHGKPALGRMLLRLHVYRCIAGVQACREYYEDLSSVDGEYLSWRETVLANKPPAMINVQANTFLKDGQVILKQYPASVEDHGLLKRLFILQFGATLGEACATFAITNIDDLFVLITFFAEATTSKTISPLKIVLGQYIGFTVIVAISMIGFGVSLVLPPEPIGFLGLLPILLGIWKFTNLFLSDTEEPTEITTAAAVKGRAVPSSMAGIFIVFKSDCYPWTIERINESTGSSPGQGTMAGVTTFILLAATCAMV
ncbi:dipeptidyl peptidase III [Apiospora phragmitis]|uniref:Dipeptidyl peptidase III n=1 Tax=Apiospora phragmitis TaxID=2905665 RepID=A0ABR1VG20_9PEZI